MLSILLASYLMLQKPQVKPPRLLNRAEIMELRKKAEQKYLQKGDTFVIHVAVMVDKTGKVTDMPHATEGKIYPRTSAVAVLLVQRMRFAPAMENGKPREVLLKIPVKLAR